MADNDDETKKDAAPADTEAAGSCLGCCSCCSGAEREPRKVVVETGKNPIIHRDRSFCCTDLLALIVFMAAMLAVFVLWCLAFSAGQVDIALYGMAWNGNICGTGVNADAKYQVWVNPTATASLYGTSVCMPACPVVNGSMFQNTNDTATFEAITTAVDTISNADTKAATVKKLETLENRVGDLKTEVTYMQKQIGNTGEELDRSTMHCLCNGLKYPEFLAFSDDGYNIGELCNNTNATARGYITLPYADALEDFIGSDKNLAADSSIMEKIPCAFRYRTERTFTRCMPWVSANALGRITLVQGASGVSDGVSATFNAASQRLVAWSTDFHNAGYVMSACAGIALFLSIFLIFLMATDCIPGCSCCRILNIIVWGTLITMAVVLAGVTLGLAHQFNYYKGLFETTPQLSTHVEDEQSMWIYGISMCVAGVTCLAHLLFISPCCCGEQISNAVDIIFCAAGVFDKAWFLLIYPLFHNFCVLTAIICWLVGLVFVATAGEVTTLTEAPNLGVHTLTYDEDFQKVFYFYFFMIIWIVEFMGAVGFMITSGAILIVFFGNGTKAVEKEGDTPETDPGNDWPVWSAIKIVLRYHCGTAALGSFMIACVVVVRIILTYLLNQYQDKDNAALAYIKACIECIMECVEQCLRYMVDTAYILTVLEGRSFFSAVCGGLWMLFANAGTVLATNYIAFLILWLLKLFVPLVVTLIGWLMIESGSLGCDKYDLSSTWVVLIPIFLISSAFSFTFIGQLGISIDVVLVGFLKMEEMAEDPQFIDQGINIRKCVPETMRNRMDEKGMFTSLQNDLQAGKDKNAAKNGTGEGQSLVQPTDETSKDEEAGEAGGT